MNKVLVIGLVIIGLLIIVYVIFMEFTDNVETQHYKIEIADGAFEVRVYEKALIAKTSTSGNYKESSSKGFRKLAGYIFGGNSEQKKIAMTAPVWMSTDPENKEMHFVMPADMKEENMPTPEDSAVVIEDFSGGRFASIRFGGYATDEIIKQETDKLVNWLEEKGYSYSQEVFFAGYNAPWKSYNRRNEILIPLN
jgi:hypothetical protein